MPSLDRMPKRHRPHMGWQLASAAKCQLAANAMSGSLGHDRKSLHPGIPRHTLHSAGTLYTARYPP